MVRVTSEQLPESQVRVTVEVEPERVAKAVDKAYRKLANQMNVPGFRRGKAPRPMIERMVGQPALIQEGLDILLNDLYRECLTELKLNPVSQPTVDLEPLATDVKLGEPLTVKFTVPVVPEVELGDYTAVRVPVLAVDVTSEQVDKSIEGIREREVEWTPVDRPIQLGDRAVMDILGQVGAYTQMYSAEGQPLVQGGEARTLLEQKGLERELATDTPMLPEGVVENIVGMKAGEQKAFEISLSQDTVDAELAGKLSTWHVTLHAAQEKHLPELDDDFAKKVGFDTFAELREEVRKRAQSQAESEARRVFETSVVESVVNGAVVELPATIVDHEIEHLIEDREQSLKRQNIELDEYLRLTQKTRDELAEEYREQAVRSVKSTLVLNKIAEVEKLEVSNEELDREIEITAAVFGDQGARIRQSLNRPDQRERMADRLLTRKVVERLCDFAVLPVEAPAAETEGSVAAVEAETSTESSDTDATSAQ